MIPPDVFHDTAYASALASPSDEHHELAAQLADEMEDTGTRLITTHAILLEIGSALARQRYRKAAITLLNSRE